MTRNKPAGRETKVKIIIIIFWLLILLPLTIITADRASRFYPIFSPPLSVPQEERVIVSQLSLLNSAGGDPTSSISIKVPEFDIIENQVGITLYAENIHCNISLQFTDDDKNAWITNSTKIETVKNSNSTYEMSYNLANYTFIVAPVWKTGLANITLVELNLSCEKIESGSRLILEKLSVANHEFNTKYVFIPQMSTTFQTYLNKYPKQKEKGTFRIVALGDSMLMGAGVINKTLIFSSLLESKLKAHYRQDIEILNFGVGGYNTEMEVDQYEQEGSKYNADMVMIVVYENDRLDAKKINSYVKEIMSEDRFKKLYAYLNKEQNESLRNIITVEANKRNGRENPVTDEDYARIIRQLDRLNGMLNGTKLVVVSLHDTPPALNGMLDSFAEENSLVHFNMNHILSTYGPKKIYILPNTSPVDSHPSEFGHAKIADALFGMIIENSLISSNAQDEPIMDGAKE